MSSGIYTITNITNNKIYVGSAENNFEIRKNKHFKDLKNNKHPNPHLQSSYNKYGEKNFIFEILEEQPKELCKYIETYWINILDTKNPFRGYNINDPIKNNKGRKMSLEFREKRRLLNLGRKASPETKVKMSLAHKGKRKPTRTKEHSEKISIANKGRKLSVETINKIKETAKIKGCGKWMLGKKLSEETKKKISIATKGSNNPNYRKKASEETKLKMRLTAKKRKLRIDNAK